MESHFQMLFVRRKMAATAEPNTESNLWNTCRQSTPLQCAGQETCIVMLSDLPGKSCSLDLRGLQSNQEKPIFVSYHFACLCVCFQTQIFSKENLPSEHDSPIPSHFAQKTSISVAAFWDMTIQCFSSGARWADTLRIELHMRHVRKKNSLLSLFFHNIVKPWQGLSVSNISTSLEISFGCTLDILYRMWRYVFWCNNTGSIANDS